MDNLKNLSLLMFIFLLWFLVGCAVETSDNNDSQETVETSNNDDSHETDSSAIAILPSGVIDLSAKPTCWKYSSG